MTREDMAMSSQVMKARTTEIWNLVHGSGCALQKIVSLVNSTVTPADEQAAARESVAVTCIILNRLDRINKSKSMIPKGKMWQVNPELE